MAVELFTTVRVANAEAANAEIGDPGHRITQLVRWKFPAQKNKKTRVKNKKPQQEMVKNTCEK